MRHTHIRNEVTMNFTPGSYTCISSVNGWNTVQNLLHEQCHVHVVVEKEVSYNRKMRSHTSCEAILPVQCDYNTHDQLPCI